MRAIPWEVGIGARQRFLDPNSGDHIANERLRSHGLSIFPGHYNLRYCETCQQHRPRGNRPAVKNWKCKECYAKRAK